MLTMTGVVGREMLVQEVCRLSQITNIPELTSSTGTTTTSTSSPSGGGAHHGAGPTCTMGGAHHGAGPSCTMGGPPTTPMVALRSDSDHQRPGAER